MHASGRWLPNFMELSNFHPGQKPSDEVRKVLARERLSTPNKRPPLAKGILARCIIRYRRW